MLILKPLDCHLTSQIIPLVDFGTTSMPRFNNSQRPICALPMRKRLLFYST
ncbi:MAG: hypothetical protein AAF902_20165 [Chloroflexota bacterium]